MPEKPKETGTEMLARMDHALNCEVLLTHDFQPRPPYKINPHPCQRCKLATFLEGLRELSAKMSNDWDSRYWGQQLDKLLGDALAEGSARLMAVRPKRQSKRAGGRVK